MEYYSLLKAREVARLRKIIGQQKQDERISQLEEQLAMLVTPKKFWGDDNAEVKYIKNFEGLSSQIRLHHNVEPKDLVVMEYFELLDTISAHAKEQKKRFRRRGRVK